MAAGGAVLMTDRLERVPSRLAPNCNHLAGVHVGKPHITTGAGWDIVQNLCVVTCPQSDCGREQLFVFNHFSVILNLLDGLHCASEQLDLNYDSGQLLSFYYGSGKILYLDASLNVVLSHTPFSVYSRKGGKRREGKRCVHVSTHTLIQTKE